MRKFLIPVLLLFSLPCFAKVHTLQVTIGASATAVVPNNQGNIYYRWVVFQNNTADTMRIGDSNVSSTRGILLSAGASYYQATAAAPSQATGNLNGWYVSGTQNDVIDIVYDDGQ